VVCIGTVKSQPDLVARAQELGVDLPNPLDPGPEGFVLASKKIDGRQMVLAIASDRRGVLYAVGEILRRMVGRGAAVAFPIELNVRSAPRCPVGAASGAQARSLCGPRGQAERVSKGL
jgi:alpha-glucuronidase